MGQDSASRPPGICRALVAIASRLAPARERDAWRAQRSADLESLCLLIERGELALHGRAHLARFFLSCFAGAFWLRFSREELARFVRGPGFVLTMGIAALAIVVLASHGLSRTRFLILLSQGRVAAPLRSARYDTRGDILFGNTAPVVVALTTSLMLLIIGRPALARHNIRYWAFLALKTGLAMLILTLLWIEGGYALRSAIPGEGLSAFWGGLVLGFAFIGAFGWSMVWSLADQRSRCPVCLGRLEMPVTMGSWASVFEPPITEFLCRDGHGSLSVQESERAASDRWVALDASWRGLFRRKSKDQDSVLR